MQQHPVPQNVIGFQFKLVGDMTLKQFGYLAGGAAAAFIVSKLPYPSIFTYPLAGLLAFFGFALAFVPVEERPLDIWVKNFIISIFSPTQFFYHKTGGNLDFLDIDLTRATATTEIVEKSLKKDKYQDYLKTLSPVKKNVIDVAENRYVKSLDFNIQTTLAPVSSEPSLLTSPIPLPPQAQTTVHSFQENAYIPLASIAAPSRVFEDIKVRPLTQEVKGEITLTAPTPVPISPPIKVRPPVIKNQFQNINMGSLTPSLKKTTQEIYRAPDRTDIKNTSASFEHYKFTRAQDADNTIIKNSENDVKRKEFIEEEIQKLAKRKQNLGRNVSRPRKITNNTIDISSLNKLGATPQTPKTPNILCGVILDRQDKAISGAIVEVKNEAEGLIVRTLKTNAIGQFAIATPLLNGTYIISVEKENYRFDNIRLILDNKIIEPILIKAK